MNISPNKETQILYQREDNQPDKKGKLLKMFKKKFEKLLKASIGYEKSSSVCVSSVQCMCGSNTERRITKSV